MKVKSLIVKEIEKVLGKNYVIGNNGKAVRERIKNCLESNKDVKIGYKLAGSNITLNFKINELYIDVTHSIINSTTKEIEKENKYIIQ